MPSLPQGVLRVLAWFDSTADELKALINDDGRMPVSIDGENVDLTSNIKLYDGSAWVKSPILWGYTDRVLERKFDLTAGAGTNTVDHTVVPAGEVWRITHVTVLNANSTCTGIRLHVWNGSDSFIVKEILSTVANVPYSYSGVWTLKEGDYFSSMFRGCTANDDLYSYIFGSKMKVAM